MSLPVTVTSLDYASLESPNSKYVATQFPHPVCVETHPLGCRWSRLPSPPGFPEASKVRNTTNPLEAQGAVGRAISRERSSLTPKHFFFLPFFRCRVIKRHRATVLVAAAAASPRLHRC